MADLEFRNIGERRQERWSVTSIVFGLLLLGIAILAIVVISGTAGEVDVSIPTRLFPRQ